MMKNFKVILLAFLIGITVFSIFKYILFLKEKNDLLNNLNAIKGQVTALENEKQNLLQGLEKQKQIQQELNEQNAILKESIKVSEEKLTKLNTDFIQAQAAIEKLNSEMSAVKVENTALRQEQDKLNSQVAEITQENEGLKAKLGSIAELKKTIKELKRQMRKAELEIERKIKERNIVEGNRGFLIKDGKPTSVPKIKIEVLPASQS